MSLEEFKEIALSFQGTLSHPHFERTTFKVERKRIFATLHEESESLYCFIHTRTGNILRNG